MNILHRAWWGVSRRWNQSFIVFLILLAIGTLVIASLLIQSTSDQARADARKAMGSEVILKSFNETGGGKIEYLPLALTDSLINSEYVESYNYVLQMHYVAKNFEPIQGEANETMEVTVTGPDADNFKMPDIQVKAVMDTSKLKEFNNGVYTLEEGRHISEENGNQPFILIEQTLAQENDLHIGDKLIMSEMFGVNQIEAEIIGIYRTTETIEDVRINMNMPSVRTLHVPYNNILAPFNAFAKIDSTTNEALFVEAIYYINDPDHIASFVNLAQTNTLFDPSKFKLFSSEEKLKSMTLAIDQVASFSIIMLWLIIICGGIILCLLFIYFVKGRLREMGILLSLGENRFKLVMQLITEVMILVIIAFSISIFTGNIVAKQATDVLLEQRQATIEKENLIQMQGAHMLNGQNAGQEAMIDTLNIKLSSDIWLRFIYVTCLIILISILFPAILIFRLKPTTILTMQE